MKAGDLVIGNIEIYSDHSLKNIGIVMSNKDIRLGKRSIRDECTPVYSYSSYLWKDHGSFYTDGLIKLSDTNKWLQWYYKEEIKLCLNLGI